MCFFFKQKTAYEMRISDWSSDVCSSDLARRALRETPALLSCCDRQTHCRVGRWLRWISGPYSQELKNEIAFISHGNGPDFQDQGLTEDRTGAGQTGRASGRERVVQTV